MANTIVSKNAGWVKLQLRPWPTVLSASCCNNIVEHLEARHQTHMRALLDQKDAVRLLRLEVNRAGSQKKWAKKNGVTQSLISMVLSGDRPLNNKIISALKLRRVVVYERLDRTAGRPSARPAAAEVNKVGQRRCSVPCRPGSSRRASQPKPTSCRPAANGCMKSNMTASASLLARPARR